MKAAEMLQELIRKQNISEKEIRRVCESCNAVWTSAKTPHKYAVVAHEAEILIRAMWEERSKK